MSDIQRVDWLNYVTATKVGFRKGYFELPAFSYENPPWAGASEIVAQYNYSADRNFYIVTPPTKPTGVNYGLCVKFRVGTTVYRYKLWEDRNFVYGRNVYNGEIIGKNFCLEVWSLNGEATSSQATAIQTLSSIRQYPDDVRDMSNFAIAESEEAVYEDLVLPVDAVAFPTGGCSQRLVAQDLALGSMIGSPTWTDRITSAVYTSFGLASYPVVAVQTAINNKKAVAFSGNSRIKGLNVIADLAFPATAYLLMSQPSWTNNDVLFESTDGGSTAVNVIKQNSVSPKIIGLFGPQIGDTLIADLPINTFKLVRFRLLANFQMGIQINDQPEVIFDATGYTASMGHNFWFASNAADGALADMKLAEYALYSKDTIADGSDDAIKAYFYQTYGIETVLIQDDGSGANIPAAQYWLDNTL